jgi:MFS family permease
MEMEVFPQDPNIAETPHRTSDGRTSMAIYIIGGVVVAGFFALLATMLVRVVPQENVGSVNQLFGTLSMAFGTVIGFFFGSSAGSKRNGEILADIAKKRS